MEDKHDAIRSARSERQMLLQQLQSLAVFRHLLQDEVLGRLLSALESAEAGGHYDVAAYSEFVAALYRKGGNLGQYLLHLVMESENPAVRLVAAGKTLPPCMRESLGEELAVFSALSAFAGAESNGLRLPGYETTAYDFAALYNDRLAHIAQKGYGIFAAYHMFTLGGNCTLLPVKNPDPQRLCELTGYTREREQILVNTRALLKGLPANNILLYGDAGTGKSSTVKALANEYHDDGLRLVEVRKNQLYQIPELMDTLAENPLKFILFIDDLSFPADDGDFTALKAILEGNVSARPRNIVVYATSNRRHMVKERYSDRLGDDMHLGDTLEEEASLSARFGLTVTFLKPDRDLYGEIVCELAKEHGIAMPRTELVEKAEAHAIRYGGRSPRTARQFVEYLAAKQVLE